RTGPSGRGIAAGAGGQAFRRPPNNGARSSGHQPVAGPGALARRSQGFHRPRRPGSAQPSETHKSSIDTRTYGELRHAVMTDLPISPKLAAMSNPSQKIE